MQRLDGGFDNGQITDLPINHIHGHFWLWVLASYEIARTMDQNSDCFKDETAKRIKAFKKKIAELRIPFAKQEYNNNGGIITGAELSIAGIDPTDKDIAYTVKGKVYKVRSLVEDFERLIRGIRHEDILKKYLV
jgi:hypothetical protein